MVKYRAEPDLWHERLVLTRIFGHVYLVATPDHDVYPLAMSMPPLLDAVVLEWDRNVDRLGDDRIYRFDDASGVVNAEQLEQPLEQHLGVVRGARTAATRLSTAWCDARSHC